MSSLNESYYFPILVFAWRILDPYIGGHDGLGESFKSFSEGRNWTLDDLWRC